MTILTAIVLFACGFGLGVWWCGRSMTNAMLDGDYDQTVERAKAWRDSRRRVLYGIKGN